jgi:hypothetical protein
MHDAYQRMQYRSVHVSAVNIRIGDLQDILHNARKGRKFVQNKQYSAKLVEIGQKSVNYSLSCPLPLHR